MPRKPITVAAFVQHHLALSPKTQREIAEEMGYSNQNIIAMIKSGVTKLPIAKVPALARALDVEPEALLRLTLQEYMPDAWSVIESVLMSDMNRLTDQEIGFIHLIRTIDSSQSIDPSSPGVEPAFRELFANLSTPRTDASDGQ